MKSQKAMYEAVRSERNVYLKSQAEANDEIKGTAIGDEDI